MDSDREKPRQPDSPNVGEEYVVVTRQFDITCLSLDQSGVKSPVQKPWISADNQEWLPLHEILLSFWRYSFSCCKVTNGIQRTDAGRDIEGNMTANNTDNIQDLHGLRIRR
jgi:hypothetical protein